jgi:hypothetical protein
LQLVTTNELPDVSQRQRFKGFPSSYENTYLSKDHSGNFLTDFHLYFYINMAIPITTTCYISLAFLSNLCHSSLAFSHVAECTLHVCIAQTRSSICDMYLYSQSRITQRVKLRFRFNLVRCILGSVIIFFMIIIFFFVFCCFINYIKSFVYT